MEYVPYFEEGTMKVARHEGDLGTLMRAKFPGKFFLIETERRDVIKYGLETIAESDTYLTTISQGS